MPGNPVYRALFFNQQDLLAHLLPEGDSLNKGDKLYDTVRSLVDSDEFQAHVTPHLKGAIASLQTALTGALARVETTLEAAGQDLAEISRNVALRAAVCARATAAVTTKQTTTVASPARQRSKTGRF